MKRVAREMQDRMAALVPGGRHVVIEDAGHFIFHDRPDIFVGEATALIHACRNDRRTSAKDLSGVAVLAFSSERKGNTDIYLVNADGTGLHRVTDAASRELEPAWSPDGERLAFQSQRPHWALYTAALDGTAERRATTKLSWSPDWSPDGRWLAFSDGGRICRVAPDGGEIEVLAEGGRNGRPAWSPDGTAVAFHSDRTGKDDVFVLHLEGRRISRVTDDPGRDFLPAWSPDGRRLAFVSDRDGDMEIYSIGIDGDDLRQLTENETMDMLPDWSADGSRIAFVSDRDGNREIYVMNVDGTECVRVTDNVGDDMDPAWRPAGRGS